MALPAAASEHHAPDVLGHLDRSKAIESFHTMRRDRREVLLRNQEGTRRESLRSLVRSTEVAAVLVPSSPAHVGKTVGLSRDRLRFGSDVAIRSANWPRLSSEFQPRQHACCPDLLPV